MRNGLETNVKGRRAGSESTKRMKERKKDGEGLRYERNRYPLNLNGFLFWFVCTHAWFCFVLT
jgi:hypothetical protein